MVGADDAGGAVGGGAGRDGTVTVTEEVAGRVWVRTAEAGAEAGRDAGPEISAVDTAAGREADVDEAADVEGTGVGGAGARAPARAAPPDAPEPDAPESTTSRITVHDRTVAVVAATTHPITKRSERRTRAFCPVPATAGGRLRTVTFVAALLLVEDDALLRQALVHDLTDRGHAVRSVPNALEALRDVAAQAPDLVILDLGLPDLDGAQALRMIRGLRADVPVIIASARDGDVDVVRLLHAGADDYLVKPFTSEQLHARVTAVLRRSRRSETPPTALTVGELVVDPLRRQAHLEGRELTLTRREFDLLAYLAARPDQVVSRRELLTQVWEHAYGQDQTIDVHLSLVRRKLGETAGAPRYLHTVRGVGVRLSAPG